MENRELHINHQVWYREIDGEARWYANDTKTNAGKRVIPINDVLFSLFVKRREEWMKIDKDTDFEVDGVRDFVFLSHQTGRCLIHNSIRRRMRTIVDANAEREVQLPEISPHILRHTRCCRWAESGCDVRVLQAWMGQADIRTTMQTYNHVDKERSAREMKRIESEKRLHQTTPNFTPIRRKVM